MALIIRRRKWRAPPKRRSTLAPVEEGRRRGAPASPFTTSMIDVLGCGFAAVFFLFLLFSSAERLTNARATSLTASGDLQGPFDAQSPLILHMPTRFAQRLDIPMAQFLMFEEDALVEIRDQRTLRRGIDVRLRNRSEPLDSVRLFVEYGDFVEEVSIIARLKTVVLREGFLFNVRVGGSPTLNFNSDLHVLTFQPDPPVRNSPFENPVYGTSHVVEHAPPPAWAVFTRPNTRQLTITYRNRGRAFVRNASCPITRTSSSTYIPLDFTYGDDDFRAACKSGI